ncbi:MAG: TatD family hydrolase, partial [Muribaculaceae bacterium]|nr:TatD family hydrolase [Muribaculaceae bacterium]
MNITDFRDIHTHDLYAGSDSIINLPLHADVPEGGYFSVGVHPWDAPTATDADLAWIERMAENPRIVAIGETGIDKLRGGDMAKQLDILKRHIALSERLAKPLILHIVRAFPEIIRLRRQEQPTQRWIIHG